MLRSAPAPKVVLVAGAALVALLAAVPALADGLPPVVTITAPAPGTVFDQQLQITASATDADGLGRITFLADGRPVKSFTANLQSGVPVQLRWKRARELTYGQHTITVLAKEPAAAGGKEATAQVLVQRVNPATLPKAATTVSIALSGRGRTRTVAGRVAAPARTFSADAFPLAGKVHVTWQVFSNHHFKTRHRDEDDASVPYRFRQRLARPGRWRVQVTYDPVGPYRPSASRTLAFRAR